MENDKTKAFRIKMTPDLHRLFKAWCAGHGVSAQAALEWAAELYVAGQLAAPPREDNT